MDNGVLQGEVEARYMRFIPLFIPAEFPQGIDEDISTFFPTFSPKALEYVILTKGNATKLVTAVGESFLSILKQVDGFVSQNPQDRVGISSNFGSKEASGKCGFGGYSVAEYQMLENFSCHIAHLAGCSITGFMNATLSHFHRAAIAALPRSTKLDEFAPAAGAPEPAGQTLEWIYNHIEAIRGKFVETLA